MNLSLPLKDRNDLILDMLLVGLGVIDSIKKIANWLQNKECFSSWNELNYSFQKDDIAEEKNTFLITNIFAETILISNIYIWIYNNTSKFRRHKCRRDQERPKAFNFLFPSHNAQRSIQGHSNLALLCLPCISNAFFLVKMWLFTKKFLKVARSGLPTIWIISRHERKQLETGCGLKSWQLSH